MGLTGLDFSSAIPGLSGLGLNSAPIGVEEWLGDSENVTSAFEAAIANFSQGLNGQDWYKIFPYQFVLIDRTDNPPPVDYSDLVPPPANPQGSSGVLSSSINSGATNFLGADLDVTSVTSLETGAAAAGVGAAADAENASSVAAMKDWQKAKDDYDSKAAAREEQNATRVVYTLPIPPDALNVKPLMASEATATMSGVVEETSPVVFWMITLSGTTGVAIGRNDGSESFTDTTNAATIFRDNLSTTGLLAGLGAGLGKLAATVTDVGNSIGNLKTDIGNGDVGSGVSDLGDIANAALLPKLPYFNSAVSEYGNGYLEMNLLHRFIVAYGDLKAERPSGTKLYFINHKDGQQFRVVVKDFQIQKSVNEPQLYRYKIVLKGWDLRDPGETAGPPIDRFKTDLSPVNTTTLTGMAKSMNNLVNNSIGNPKNIIPIVP